MELADGTRLQIRSSDRAGIRSNRTGLVLSILIDGAVSYLLVTGIQRLMSRKSAEQRSYSAGYPDAIKEVQKQMRGKVERNPNGKEAARMLDEANEAYWTSTQSLNDQLEKFGLNKPPHDSDRERNQEKDGGISIELLDCLGVDQEGQRLFASAINQEFSGRIYFNHRDSTSEIAGREYFTVTHLKKASEKVSLCLSEDVHIVKDAFISNSMIELIAFCHCLNKRASFRTAVFFSTGLKPDRQLFLEFWRKFKNAKVYLLYGNSLLGRIIDCKIAHWLRGEDYSFYLCGSQVVSSAPGEETIAFPREGFSMRSYFRRRGGRNPVATCKPSLKSIDNYINLLTDKSLQP